MGASPRRAPETGFTHFERCQAVRGGQAAYRYRSDGCPRNREVNLFVSSTRRGAAGRIRRRTLSAGAHLPHSARMRMYALVRGLALVLALAACSSSGQGGSAGSAGRGGGGGATGAAGQTGGGGAGGLAPVTLHIKWSTWQLSGTTLMPVTCPVLGVDTVGYQFNGPTLETQDNEYSSGGSDCAAGE